MNGLDAFRIGLSRAARHREVLGILVAVSLLTALVAVAPAAVAWVGAAHRPAARHLVDGVEAWMIIDALSTPPVDEGTAAFAGEGTQRTLLLALVTVVVLVLLTWLSSAFLGGGVLRTYAESDHFRWRQFLRDCWRWFGALLWLSFLQAVGTAVLGTLLLLLVLFAASTMGWLGAWMLASIVILAVAWLAFMDLTRVVAVVGETRNVLRASRQGLRVLFRRPLAVGALYGLSVLACIALLALYRWALVPRLPRAWWLIAFILQQGFVALWLWVRLGRWAGGTVLYQASAEGVSDVAS